MLLKLTSFLPEVRTGANGARFAYPPTFHNLPQYRSFYDAVVEYVKHTGAKCYKYSDTRALLKRGKYIYYLTCAVPQI